MALKRTLFALALSLAPATAAAQPPADPPPPADDPPPAEPPPPADQPPDADEPPPADDPPPAEPPPPADSPPPADRPPHAHRPPRRGQTPPGYGPPPPGYGHPPPGYGPPPYGYSYGYRAPQQPTGYRTESEPIYPMVIAGAAAFGGAWFVSAMVATATEQDNETGWLYIPVVGPFITLGAREYGDSDCASFETDILGDNTCERTARAEDTYAGVGLVLDGVVQAGGLAIFIAGLALRRERVIPTYSIAPLPVREGGGVQLTGSF